MFRVLLRLRKGEEVKYLSHRDFIRAFEFALRRARIPVAFSEGFNPRAKMSFGNALGVGMTSDDERIQLELASPLEPSTVGDVLNSKLPAGMEILSAEVVQEGVKSPLSHLNASEYRIEVSHQPSQRSATGEYGFGLSAVKCAIERLLGSDEIRVTREREDGIRQFDLRPHLLYAKADQEGDGVIGIIVELGAGDSGGAGPRDFLKALRSLLPDLNVIGTHRMRQFSAAAGR